MSNFITIENASLAGVHGGETTMEGTGEMSVNYGPASGTIKGGGKVTTNDLADCYAQSDKICTAEATRTKPGALWGSTTFVDPAVQAACLKERQNSCNATFSKK
jgi:hypothetical protein